MKRPDLDTLVCVNAERQLFRRAGASNLAIRKVYGHDRLRLLRCRTCGEAFSEQHGTARFHDQHVHGLTPRVLEFDELWSFVVRRIGWVRRAWLTTPRNAETSYVHLTYPRPQGLANLEREGGVSHVGTRRERTKLSRPSPSAQGI